jgi:hypothetical protein
MNQLEKALLDELTDGAEPKLLLRSRSRIDAGRWWRSTPVWICISESELILFAVARRRYVERVPLADCRSCHYTAATGELVINSAETLRMKRIRLTLREALDVIDFLTKK